MREEERTTCLKSGYLVEYRFLGVRGLSWGDSGGRGGVTEDTLSDRVECAIAGTSLGSKILRNSDSTISAHSESCTAKEQRKRYFRAIDT